MHRTSGGARCEAPHRERVATVLAHAVAGAWRAFDRAGGLASHVTPSAPILFFGNLDAYLESQLRVLTVGLNPSWREFPTDEPFRRFPLLIESHRNRETNRYLDSMTAYFRTAPYRRWFGSFEPLLDGLGAGYYASAAATALHTDICSPVATNPTWSALDKAYSAVRAALETDGSPVWHTLLEALRPQVVVLSVEEKHLGRIKFAPMSEEWESIHSFERTRNGSLRAQPYRIRARWFNVEGDRSLFVVGAPKRTPFGALSNAQKREAGMVALGTYRRGGLQVDESDTFAGTRTLKQ